MRRAAQCLDVLRCGAAVLTLVVFLLAPTVSPTRSLAQSPPPWVQSILGQSQDPDGGQDPATELSVAELRAAREALDAEIEALRSRGEDALAEGEAAADEGAEVDEAEAAEAAEAAIDAATRLRRLEKIRSLLGQQIDELRRAETLQQDAEDLAAREEDGVGELVDHEPPFTLDDLDSVLARLEASKARRSLLEDTVAAGTEALEEAKERLGQAEKARRQARERAENAPAESRRRLETALEDERRSARLAQEEATQVRLQLGNDRHELELVQRQAALLERGIEWIRSQLTASETVLQTHLDALVSEQAELRERLTRQRVDIRREESRLLRAEGQQRAQDAEVARAALDLLDHRQRMLEDRIERRGLQAELWRLRHRLIASPQPDNDQRAKILAAIQRDQAELERDRRLLSARAQDLRASEARIADRLLAGPDSADRDALLRRQQLLAEQISSVEAQISDVESTLTLVRRAAGEAETMAEGFNLAEMSSSLWQEVVSWWRWEILVVDNHAITLGKVVLAILLLIAGYLASKRLSRAFGRVLRRRFGLSDGAAAALQSIAFYLMVVAILVWAMQLVSIPLTVFTLLGGVLAIGIGFGSQNVVNNFISGLILLVERPVRVGDLIEVEGTVGSVERIGLRSTRVRSGDNTHIIVPNSTFLEQKVLNWTISDDLVRTHVDVGIAYGSPTRKAAELMQQALDDEPRLIATMPKEILFIEFGDNSLLFRAYFWTRIQAQLDTQRAQSAVRYRIDESFREAGIAIAFPQRDVHLDTLSPLQIRLLGQVDDKVDRGADDEVAD